MIPEARLCLDALTAPTDRTEIIDVLRVERLRRRAAADTTEWRPAPSQDRVSEDRMRSAGDARPRDTVGSWSAWSAVAMPWGRVLYRLARSFGGRMLEVGAGAGVSAAYISAGLDHSAGSLITIEPDERLVGVAVANLESGRFEHVVVQKGSQERDAEAMIRRHRPRLVHVDSDHRHSGITTFTQMLSETVAVPTIVCYDDIRWSLGMERFWSMLRAGAHRTRLAIDLGGWGVTVIDPTTVGRCHTIVGRPPRRFEGVCIDSAQGVSW